VVGVHRGHAMPHAILYSAYLCMHTLYTQCILYRQVCLICFPPRVLAVHGCPDRSIVVGVYPAWRLTWAYAAWASPAVRLPATDSGSPARQRTLPVLAPRARFVRIAIWHSQAAVRFMSTAHDRLRSARDQRVTPRMIARGRLDTVSVHGYTRPLRA
jgi:hypothetical protein